MKCTTLPRSRLAAAVIGLSIAALACDRASLTSPVNLSRGKLPATAHAADVSSFSGEARGVDATILSVHTVLVQAGPLPSNGGAQDESLVNASIPGAVGAQAIHASVNGAGDRSVSQATTANLQVGVGALSLSARVVNATATATCTAGGASTSGSSNVVGLVINGQNIAVSGAPNQTVNLLGIGSVVINEQIPGAGSLTVNALHIRVTGIADIIVSHAHADVVCGSPSGCHNRDFIVGQGAISGPSPGVIGGEYDVNLGINDGVLFFGHMIFDSETPQVVQIRATSLTVYQIVSPTMRHAEGSATKNGVGGFTYFLDITDNGEPSTSDTWTIRLSDGYSTSGTVIRSTSTLQILHEECVPF
jgi:hypothetical protein